MRWVEVAGDNQGCVVRAIECFVELPHILDGCRIQVSDRTDDTALIGVRRERVLIYVKLQAAVRASKNALSVLLLDNRPFRAKVRVVDT